MRRIVLIFILVSYSIFGFAGKLEKGFEALEMFNYFEAKKIFEKSLKKSPIASSFGLCKVYDAEKSPFFNVDTAFKFINICDSNFHFALEKERLKLSELEIDSMSILSEKIYLATFFFARANESSSLEAYQEFIDNHPESEDLQEAIKLRDHSAYKVALKENSIESWTYFVLEYPNSNDYKSARKQLQILEYKLMTQNGDADSYRLFVQKYPENPYAKDAQEMVYQMYTQDKQVESYALFIEENADNKNIKNAWNELYNISIAEFTPAQIFEFMIDFPDFPNKELLQSDLKLSMTELFPVKDGELWGYVDTNGSWWVKPQYSWASSFQEGKATVGLVGKSVYINKRGSLIYQHLFDEAESFTDRLAIVGVNDQYGVINYVGDTIVPLEYDELGVYSNDLIYAGKDGAYGYLSKTGETVIPFNYTNAFDFEGNIAIVSTDTGYGVINEKGNILINPTYENVQPQERFCISKWKGMYGILSYLGDTILPFEYDAIGKFSNDRGIAAKGNTFVYINENSEIAIEEEFEYNSFSLNYSIFINGYARVIVKDRVGVIDTLGKRVYPAIFSDIGMYQNNLTAITKGDKWGYANSDVKLIIPYTYNFAYDFKYSVAVVQNDTSQALINKNNEFLIPFGYDKLTPVDSNYLLVENELKFGVLNYVGDTIVPIEYSNIEWISEDKVLLQKSDSISIFWISRMKFIYKEETEY